MTKTQIIEHLKAKKDEFRLRYGITALGLYGSYARDEANEASDVDVFYERPIVTGKQIGRAHV